MDLTWSGIMHKELSLVGVGVTHSLCLAHSLGVSHSRRSELLRCELVFVSVQVLHMILGLERLDRITMFLEEVATLPRGGDKGLSGRLDSHPPEDANPPAAAASQRSRPGQGSQEKQKKGEEEQLRGQPKAGPTSLLYRHSVPDLHAPPPHPTLGTPPVSSSASFPLNPHHSYDAEWGTMGRGEGDSSFDDDVFLTPAAHPTAMLGSAGVTPNSNPMQSASGPAPQQPEQLPAKIQPGLAPALSPAQPSDPAHAQVGMSSAASAPLGTPPGTPERAALSTSRKFHSPQHHQVPQLQQRSPTLLSRANARLLGRYSASEALSRAAPADPPPHQPGLPPSGGHRRATSSVSHQVCQSLGFGVLTGLQPTMLAWSPAIHSCL